MSFSQKVLIAILAMTGLLMGGVLFFFNLQTRKIANAEVENRLSQTRTAFERFQKSNREKLRWANHYISGNSSFVAYIADAIDNSATEGIDDQFHSEIVRFTNPDFMIVLDVDGNLVYDSSRTIAKTAENELNVLRTTLEAQLDAIDEGDLESTEENSSYIGLLPTEDKLYNVIISPVYNDEYQMGYNLVGYLIDQSDAEEIGTVSNCDLLILCQKGDQSMLAASYFEGNATFSETDLLPIIKNRNSGEIFDFRLGDESYKGLIVELAAKDMHARYITMKSTTKETVPFRKIQWGMLIIAILALIFIAPLAMLTARGVTKPVNQLVSAIEKVREGEYKERDIQVQSSDEIGIMANAFKTMVRELREQRELIEFLEQSAASDSQQEFDPDATVDQNHMTKYPSMSSSIMAQEIQKAMDSNNQLPKGFVLVNRYEILGTLGKGGMGIVYRAKDNSLDEVVAIKMLHLTNPAFADMLKQETRLARKVTHRNILRIYDLSELDEIQFISMEYVKGHTMKDVLKRTGPLPLNIGLRVARQTCLGLAAAHGAGIVHGDIKPENIIIDGRGIIKVMDFGVARVTSMEETADGNVSGTPTYMSPEQFQGKVDPRSDIYSTGIMLYEFFAGQVPFRGGNITELFKHHYQSPLPPLKDVNPNLPQELVTIIEKATAKDVNQRFSTAKEMHLALKQIGD